MRHTQTATLFIHSLCLLILSLSFLGACGSATPTKEAAQPEPGSDHAEYEAQNFDDRPAPSAPHDPRSGAAAESKAEDYDGYRDEAPARRPRRPGLATQWGESRDSEVRQVSFERQRSNPAGVVSVYYDDEEGIEAATGRSADEAYPRTFPVRGGVLTVSIADDDGDPLPTMHVGGHDYVVGDSGDRYQIEIKNHSAGRFEIVASVDGLDVLDGGDGSYSKRGYLVAPWSTLTIEGFRESFDTVRAFRFGNVETSYAVRRSKGRNVGVIGVAVFEERGFRWGYDDDELRRRQSADPFPGRFAPPPY